MSSRFGFIFVVVLRVLINDLLWARFRPLAALEMMLLLLQKANPFVLLRPIYPAAGFLKQNLEQKILL